MVPCHLAPPLRESWMMKCDGAFDVLDLVRVDDSMLYLKRPRTGKLTALREETRGQVWVYPIGFAAADLLSNGTVFSWAEADRLHLIEAKTGKPVRVLDCPTAGKPAVVGDILVAQAYKDNRASLFAMDLRAETQRWRVTAPEGVFIEGLYCLTSSRVVYGVGKSTLVALALEDGRELWRHSIAELTWNDVGKVAPGYVQGAIVGYRDSVIVEVGKHYVVALSLQDGRRLWTWHLPNMAVWQGYLYGDRYYAIGGFGSYHILDASSGEVLFETDLHKTLPPQLQRFHPHAPFLVSETHVFTATLGPYVLAFERETGEYAWSHAAKDGGDTSHGGAYFMSANGRLYYGDMAFRMYCLEEEYPTDPTLARQRQERGEASGPAPTAKTEPVAAPRELAFAIEEAWQRRRMTDAAPWYEEGGDWTVLRCRTVGKDSAGFFMAIREGRPTAAPIKWSEGRLWVSEVPAGEALLKAFQAAFPAPRSLLGRRKRFRGGSAVSPPTAFGVAVLGERVARPATGVLRSEGGWTGTKWTDDLGAELFVHWNIEEKAGMFGEKDEAYRKDLVERIASLLSR